MDFVNSIINSIAEQITLKEYDILKQKNGKIKCVSRVLQDKRLVELVYKETENKTLLAVYDGKNGVEYCEELRIENEILIPYPLNDLIKNKVILFPSEAEDYKNESELLEEIKNFIHRYVGLPQFFEEIGAFYVLFTWVYDKFNELPYLRLIGDYGCGKTRGLQVIGSVCYKPMIVGGATTPSPIFRIIDEFKGTLIIDEGDYKNSDATAEITKILTTGYQKGIPVLRTEGKGVYNVKAFDVFCPKIVATRNKFQDQALESRFIVFEMDQKFLRDDIPLNLPDKFYEEALRLRNKLLMWRFKNFHNVVLENKDIDRTIEPRLNQIILPLLSIVKDEKAKLKIKDFIRKYNGELILDRSLSEEAEVIRAILEAYKSKGEDLLLIKEITEVYNAKLDEKEKITAKKIGWILRNKLKLKLERKEGGTILSIKKNKEKIEDWIKRLSIDEEIDNENCSIDILDIPY